VRVLSNNRHRHARPGRIKVGNVEYSNRQAALFGAAHQPDAMSERELAGAGDDVNAIVLA